MDILNPPAPGPINNDKKTIAFVGLAGNGKSTCGNQMVGNPNAFTQCSDYEGGTQETSSANGNFHGMQIVAIDTPGLDDRENIDAEHIIKMVKFLKPFKTMSAIILCVNFTQPRMTGSLLRLFEVYFRMFNNPALCKNMGIVFTHYYAQMKDEFEPQKQKKASTMCKIIGDLYEKVYGDRPTQSPSCFFVDLKNKDDPELGNIAVWLSTLDDIQVDPQEVHDKIKQKSKENRTRVVKEDTFVSSYTEKVVGHGARKYIIFGPKSKIITKEPVFGKKITQVDEEREVFQMYDGKIHYGEWIAIKTYE